MAGKKAPTERKAVTLTAEMWRYLDDLAQKGTHGSDAVGVASTLVAEGVRQAIRDSFIALHDDPETKD